MLVGEQPGDQEDRSGRPFVGPAGRQGPARNELALVGIAPAIARRRQITFTA
jgi:uracil-DNA glycosylase family 4